jgi:leucyl aminopeptidase
MAYRNQNIFFVEPTPSLSPSPSLTRFTSFRTRYYRSDTGKASSEWLLGKIEEYTSKAPAHIRSQISVAPFPHTWAQTSIIVKFTPPTKEGRKEPITIVSAHCDSTNLIPFLPAPGADGQSSNPFHFCFGGL